MRRIEIDLGAAWAAYEAERGHVQTVLSLREPAASRSAPRSGAGERRCGAARARDAPPEARARHPDRGRRLRAGSPPLPHPLPPGRRARPGPDRPPGARRAGGERDDPGHRGGAPGEGRATSPSEPTSRSCTPNGRSPRTGRRRTGGWSSRRRCPSSTRRAGVRGALVGGLLLNRKFALVDRIRSTVFGDRTFEGKPVGTVTLFLGDVRVATNVMLDAGTRALGTRVSKRGLREGRRAGRALRGPRLRRERLVPLRVRPHPRPRGPRRGHHLRRPPREGVPAVRGRPRPAVPRGEPSRRPPLRGRPPSSSPTARGAPWHGSSRPPARSRRETSGRGSGRRGGAGRSSSSPRPSTRWPSSWRRPRGGSRRRPPPSRRPTPRPRRRTAPTWRCSAS